jgi:hypothetical protein
MHSEALAKKLHGELDRWSREEEKHAERAGNILLPRKHDSLFRLEGSGPGAIGGDEEVTDEAPFVREPPIDLSGPWRAVFHCNFWWVAGHRFLHPCRDERAAEKLCARLREEWDENSLSAASRASG